MGKYAIIRVKGHQYKVAEKEQLFVDKLNGDVGAEVLLMVDKDKAEIGQPICKKAKVVIKKLEDKRGEKIYVSKYKAKSRYRKRIGFRADFTKIEVEKISA